MIKAGHGASLAKLAKDAKKIVSPSLFLNHKPEKSIWPQIKSDKRR
jgi:hypothetical protein